MKTFVSALVIVSWLVAFSAVIGAEEEKPGAETILRNFVIDRTITYQGILKDNAGNPVGDNSYNLTFRIYESSAGGSPVWTSPTIPVTTQDGYFSAIMTSVSLPFDTTYYLSIQVQGDTEMSQRQRMTLSPYSATADTANYSFRADTASYALNSGGGAERGGFGSASGAEGRPSVLGVSSLLGACAVC